MAVAVVGSRQPVVEQPTRKQGFCQQQGASEGHMAVVLGSNTLQELYKVTGPGVD